MEKINTEILVPVSGKKYDFLLPSVMKINTVIDLVFQSIREEEPYSFADRNQVILCSKDKGCTLRGQATLEQEGIRDGSILILL